AAFAAAFAALRTRPDEARAERTLNWMMERAFVPRGRLTQETWHRSLARAGTGGWLAAAAYESGVRYPWTYAGQSVFAAVVTYALQMPFMLLIGLAPVLSERGMRLTGG